MPASLCHPPRHSQEHFAALSSDPLFSDENGNFSTGLAIGLLLTIAGGGLVGFCVTLARMV